MRPKHRSRLARWAVIPIGVAAAIALAGCTEAQLRGYLPGEPGVTDHTDGITALWVNSWIVLLVVGLVTWGLVIWAAIAYRRRKGQSGLPVQLRYNMPIEIFYTIVPLILVIGFFAFTAREQTKIEADNDPEVQIEVYGKRWAWDFNYVTDDVYFQGIQAQTDGEDGRGDIVDETIPTLYLPVNKRVEIKIESRDVIHSFWIIDFLYKKDMIPAKSNYMYFEPLKEGTYQGKCAELCGEYHSLMLFQVEVVSQAEYDAYIEERRADGFEGQVPAEYNTNTNLPGNGASTTEIDSPQQTGSQD
ncbi:aa3-type cytochrome oxidase subunit II [Homoserinibacter sp. YIM 151385]|uniref:aa3-type cytochrome oxidase subunit II n=1 Tax=Homoserinibacter sp. YIM 151385 TaxID=2985506 RepID=UPI0022F060A6|nr:cytochrome c oxidase subunit II [Homoserinibacter sp. YIM 151385]WBU38722.1 cytochrome c oxidase subunit II [Homoserinibacter sp. YIM 151385]